MFFVTVSPGTLLRLGGWAALLALCVAAWFVAPVSADGLILDARPVGEAGPQLDAAVISPLPARTAGGTAGAAQAVASSETYTVQPGDTLAAIAGRFDMGVSELVSANGITNPDRIVAGQVLKVAATAVAATAVATLALPDGGPLVRVQLWPWPPAQGQTLAVWLEVRQPVTLSVALDGRAYPVVMRDRRGWALIPIPPLTAPGIEPLTIGVGGERMRMRCPSQQALFPP